MQENLVELDEQQSEQKKQQYLQIKVVYHTMTTLPKAVQNAMEFV